MTEIDFYTHVEDKAAVACALAAKAWERGLRVLVYTSGPAATAHFDRLLWTHQQLSFVPHCRGGSALAPVTPILIDHRADEIDRDDVLVNLHDELPGFFSRFHRLVEIVSLDEADRQRGRERYRYYRDRGYEIRSHDLSTRRKG